MKVQYELVDCRKQQLQAIQQGFFTLDGLRDRIRHVLPQDLRTLLCGVEKLDCKLLLANMQYENWSSSPTPAFLRTILGELKEEDLRRFLRLCTSMASLPREGLRQKIRVTRSTSNTSHLPVGHTCFHQLDLPDYRAKELLRRKLLLCLSHIDVTGFGYA